MIDLYIVRHGESCANAQNILSGHGDTPLSEKWEKQAQALQKYLLDEGYEFDEIYSSPLERAQNTIAWFAKQKDQEIILDPRLKEKALGQLESVPIDQVFWDAYWMDPYYYDLWDGYETYTQLTERIYDFLQQQIFPKTGKKILVSCHAGVTRGFISALTGMKRELPYIKVQNASISHYRIDEATFFAECKMFGRDVYLRESGLL